MAAAISLDDAILDQAPDHPVDVNGGQAGRVTNFFLREGQLNHVIASLIEAFEAYVQLAEERRDPRSRRSPANRSEPIGERHPVGHHQGKKQGGEPGMIRDQRRKSLAAERAKNDVRDGGDGLG